MMLDMALTLRELKLILLFYGIHVVYNLVRNEERRKV